MNKKNNLHNQTTRTVSMVLIATVAIVATCSSMLAAPHANAVSDAKRASDGFNDGSNQARIDTTFNPACDPQGVHTSDGQHTTIYCNAWAQGYISTWNQLYPPSQQPPSQNVGPGGSGQQSSPNIILQCKNVVNCNPNTAQRTDQNGEVTTR